jgi:serine/threonine-protein kinase
MGEAPTDNVAAYDLYLQARQFTFANTRISYQSSLALYQEALNLDPGFKLAWIGVANAHMTNYWSYGGNPADRDKAREAIDKAREIDSDFPELYMAEGFYWYWGHLDYDRALYNLARAIELMPGNPDAWMWQGWASRRAGRWEQAIASMQQAVRMDPRVSLNWAEYGSTLEMLHRFDEAREAYRKALDIDPESYFAKAMQSLIEIQELGDAEAAVRLTTGGQHTQEFDVVEAFLMTHVAARRFEEALEAARKLPDVKEVQRSAILLREDKAAEILHFMGRHEESRAAADAAWFRLQSLRDSLGDDYRILTAEARLSALRGEDADAVRARVTKARKARPADALEEFRFDYEVARIFAMAGLTNDVIPLLEPQFAPPSETSVYRLELDPAFDGIREEPEFTAMMERHR